MTSAERQRRRRAKLHEVVVAENVVEALQRDYRRAFLGEQAEIRRGVTKLLARWRREAEADQRYWAKRFPK